ncbi:MAG: hypothetical protein ACOYN0_13350 [Phycisphaerales bacterium]
MSTFSSPATVFSELPSTLPTGYACAPLTADAAASPVRLAVVVRTEAGKGVEGGPFVLLRELLDARVYLGAICDSSGRVLRWVELWVQDLAGLAGALPTFREVLNNRVLDDRWAERCEWFDRTQSAPGRPFGGGGLVHTGWESSHPAPILIDTKRLMPVAAKDRRTNAAWELCTDDAALGAKGAPGYSSTLVRCLWQKDLGEQSPLVEIDSSGVDLSALGAGSDVAPLNAGGGLMMVAPYAPLSYEQYVDALTGGPTDTPAGDALQRLLAQASTAGGADGGGWLMMGSPSGSTRLVETLHLKLMAFTGAVAAVRAALLGTQTPLLNVTASSFRVRMAEGAGVAPLWWTARTCLVQPGESVELPIPATQAKYYVGGRSGNVSIYSAGTAGRSAQGRGWLRLRNVTGDMNGAILEGTLATQERVQAGANDLLWLRFGVGATRVDLYAVVDAQQAMAAGEIRIRTLPHALNPDIVTRLRSALGVPIQDVSFEMVPLLSSPCDMYALAVLGVRTLLVDGTRPLPVALDDMLSLAMQAGRGAGEGRDLADRIGDAMKADARFVESLGAHRLLHGGNGSEEAFAAIPPRLWYRALAAVIRMFSGLGPDSLCRDYGDAPPGGIHKIFDPVMTELYALLVACRSLIVPDAAQRVELRGVVNECLRSVKR